MHSHDQENNDTGNTGRARYWLPISVFAIAIGYYLYFEHRAHIPGDYLFTIIFLVLCGGMHFFMHGGHGHGHDQSTHQHRNASGTGDGPVDTPPNSISDGDDK